MSGILTDEQRDRMLIELHTQSLECAKDIKEIKEEGTTTAMRVDALEVKISSIATTLKWLQGVGAAAVTALASALGINFKLG